MCAGAKIGERGGTDIGGAERVRCALDKVRFRVDRGNLVFRLDGIVPCGQPEACAALRRRVVLPF